MPTDHTEIAETITRVFHALDDHDWQTIASSCAERIDVDYPSMPGGPVVIGANELTGGLGQFLPGFKSTQHLAGYPAIRIEEDDRANARLDVLVTHVLDDAGLTKTWTIGVRYTFGLTKSAGVWKVDRVRSVVMNSAGDPDIADVARRRAVQPPSGEGNQPEPK